MKNHVHNVKAIITVYILNEIYFKVQTQNRNIFLIGGTILNYVKMISTQKCFCGSKLHMERQHMSPWLWKRLLMYKTHDRI